MEVLIGIAGRKRNGKDTAAAGLEGFENVKFAGAIKVMVRAFLAYVGFDEASIDRYVDGDWKEVPLPCFGGKSTRFVMQTLGTEWGRNMIWDEIWINAFRDRATQFEKVVCTDMRFPNEVAFVKDMGGVTVRVVNSRLPRSTDDHPSEALIDTLQVDWEIANDWGIEDLHVVINSVVNSAQSVSQ